MPLHSVDPAYDYSREIREIAELGAAWVSLQVVTLQERRRFDSEVPLASKRTPPETGFERRSACSRSWGSRSCCLPIVLIRDPGPDDWRGTLGSVDRAAWWESYSRYLLHMVDLAAEVGASAVSVGSEMASIESDEVVGSC